MSKGKHTIITPREADIGDGFTVRRSLPARELRSVGPWVFFDHMGPADLSPGKGLDVIPHPHINLATVTYLFEGEIVHRDSIGSVQTIKPGAINLMVAGRGVVHSERTDSELRKQGHRAHGLQLWMALPEDMEEVAPSFHHHEASSLPKVRYQGADIRVMMGSAFGVTSPVLTFLSALYAEASVPAGEYLSLEPTEAEEDERAVYLVSGSVSVNGEKIDKPAMIAAVAPGHRSQLTIHADTASRVVIIAGRNPGKRYIWWNFVSSRPERIEQAKEEWKNRRMNEVPGETGFAELPASDSFSRMK